jgi:isoquinoline 1-oxidoreductase beta subunit
MQKQLDGGKANGELTIGNFDEINLSELKQSAEYYRLGHQNQTPMEPIAMTAHHQGDRFELWTSTQYPADFRDRIAEITELDQDHITLHNTIMGGSFGRRYVRDAVTEVIMIADHLRQPVKLVWTREDDIRNGQYRNASLSKVEAHFDDAGKLHRWYQKAVQTSPDDPSEVKGLSSGMSDQAYQFEAARYEMHGLKGNVNLGPMRSPPHPAKLFPTVCFIDELAHQLNEDPIDLHIRLIGSYRDLPQSEWLTGFGHADNTGTHVQVANAVRAMSDWDKPLPEGHGKGFAVGYFFGTHVGMVVETAWRDEMISIEKVWCAVNCGRVINPDVARQQIEGGTIYGLSGAMGEVITTAGGGVQQNNFHDYPIMRFAQAPEIEVEFIKSDERPSGLGEPATPPAYPALANSVFASSGKRIREIPLNRHIKFAPFRRFT